MSSVRQLQDILGIDINKAKQLLSEARGDMNVALDMHYSDASNRSKKVDVSQIEKFFLEYKSNDGDAIGYDETLRFLGDLEIAPEDPVALVIAWHCECKTLGRFEKKEFESGMKEMGVSTKSELKSRLSSLRASLTKEDVFLKIYKFAFGYMASDPNKRENLRERCVAYWKILLDKNSNRLVNEWIRFMEEYSKKRDTIKKDEWDLLPQFFIESKENNFFKEFDPSKSSWPLLIDEFVANLIDLGVVTT